MRILYTILLLAVLSATALAQNPCDDLNAGFQVTVNGPVAIFHTGSSSSQHYIWHFGDGSTSEGPQPAHTYSAPGTYTACLATWAWNTQTQDTCWADHCETVVITGADPCDQLNACFVPNDFGNGTWFFDNCTSGPNGTQYSWSFGDGTNNTVTNAEHHYDQPGTYTVCLTAYWQNCVDSTCVTITVPVSSPCDELTAGFEASPAGLGVNFANDAIDFSWTYLWQFGDGTTGSGPNPYHTYPGPGIYTVCLLVWVWDPLTQDTCFADQCELITVVNDDPCADLEACFVPNDFGNGTWFFDNCTSGPNGTQYSWSFGDGTNNTVTNAEHHYDQPGTYMVCLTAYWQNCVDSTCVTITVPVSSPCDELTAGFEASPAGLGVNFANDAIDFSWTYLWQFGDGTTGSGPNPYHTYPGPGIYTVCLLVWVWDPLTQDTCFADQCELITVVNDDPCADLEACFVPNDFGNGTWFFDNCTSGPNGTQYSWSFGDGTNNTVTNAEHHYDQPGTYTVCLTAYWQNCVDSTCTTITVGTTDPCVGLVAEFTSTTTPNGTFFSNGTTGTGFQTSFFWDFGDGQTSNDAQPFHTYSSPGTYEACLQVLSIFELAGGVVHTCLDTVCHVVVIGTTDPCAGFDAAMTWDGGASNTVLFAGTTNLPADGYVWYFGDGTEGYDQTTSHAYSASGTYEVCFAAYIWSSQTQDTCWTEACQTITVGSGGPCDQLNACFTAQPTGNGNMVFHSCTTPGTNTQYVWDFGDGTTGTNAQADHHYTQPGTYTVCLTAYWQNCVDSTCTTIIVTSSDPCDQLQVCFWPIDQDNGNFLFENCSTAPVGAVFEWTFGDGTGAAGYHVEHHYDQPGTYTVCILATWGNCADSTCSTVVVEDNASPCDSLNAGFQVTVDGQVAIFHTGSNNGQHYIWHFGDGTSGDGPQPVHTYSEPGTYTACLAVWAWDPQTQDTCWADHCETIVILPLSMAEAASTGGLKAWPQPFPNGLTLSGSDLHGPYQVSLVDLTGQVVDDRHVVVQGSTLLDYGFVPPGPYILRVRGITTNRAIRVLKY